jgi:hypothetical protein
MIGNSSITKKVSLNGIVRPNQLEAARPHP